MAKKSALRQEYEKQIKRIKDSVKRAEKKGLKFDTSPVPEMPKRVTKKKLEEIKDLTYRDIWTKGYKESDKGEKEFYSPYEASKEASRKRQETIKGKKNKEPRKDDIIDWDWKDNGDNKDSSQDDITDYDWDDDDDDDYDYPFAGETMYNNLLDEIANGKNGNIASFIYEYLQDTVDYVGLEKLYRRLEEATDTDIMALAQTAVNDSDSEEVKNSCLALLEIINGGSVEPWVAEELGERINQDIPKFYKHPKRYKNPSKSK